MSFLGRQSSPAKDLVRLLCILGLAVVFAFAIAFYFIHFRSPTGSHKVEAVVLLGDTLEDLNYIDEGTAGTSARYLFDKITFQAGQEKPIPVPVKKYQEFLLELHGDRSLVGQEAEKGPLFQGQKMAHLLLFVASSSGGAHPQRKIFQEIQILKDDYRVNLHGSGMKEEWAYFHHPDIGSEAVKLLVGVKE
jgi:hypothetical protein